MPVFSARRRADRPVSSPKTFYLEQAGQRAPRLSVNRVGLARGSDSTGRVSPLWSPTRYPSQAMPDTPTLTLVHSEIRDLLQGAKLSANALQTECDFVLAASLPELAANLATFFEWSRLQDEDGIGYFFLTNCAVYIDNISPTVCGTSADAVRCARHELEQLELRNLSDLLEFVADDTRKPTADDFAQTVAVHKSVSEKQAAIVAGIVVVPRVIKRVDTIFAETILKTFFADDALRTIYREKAARIQGAGGTSIALLAAIRSSIADVRPKLQRLILETVAVKSLLASGFGAQAGRIHADLRRRVRRVTRVNDWLEDERLNPTQLTALLTKFLTELTNESFRSDVDIALNAIVCARRSVVIKDLDDADVLEGGGNADKPSACQPGYEHRRAPLRVAAAPSLAPRRVVRRPAVARRLRRRLRRAGHVPRCAPALRPWPCCDSSPR